MIVAIDDDIDILSVYYDTLKENHDVVLFSNPIQGVDFIKKNKNSIKCLILDKMMVPIDGISILKSFWLMDIYIPAIINTGLVTDEDQFNMDLLNEGMTNKAKVIFIEKTGDLTDHINKLLGPRDNKPE